MSAPQHSTLQHVTACFSTKCEGDMTDGIIDVDTLWKGSEKRNRQVRSCQWRGKNKICWIKSLQFRFPYAPPPSPSPFQVSLFGSYGYPVAPGLLVSDSPLRVPLFPVQSRVLQHLRRAERRSAGQGVGRRLARRCVRALWRTDSGLRA